MEENKNLLLSMTIWGVLVAGCGVLAESGSLLENLVGSPWADRLVIVSGLILAFIGRLKATKVLTIWSKE